jgi:hypothetical protein
MEPGKSLRTLSIRDSASAHFPPSASFIDVQITMQVSIDLVLLGQLPSLLSRNTGPIVVSAPRSGYSNS